MDDEKNSYEDIPNLDRVRQSIMVEKFDYVSDQVLSEVLSFNVTNAGTDQANDGKLGESKSVEDGINVKTGDFGDAIPRKARRSVISKRKSNVYETARASDAKLQTPIDVMASKGTSDTKTDESNIETHPISEEKLREIGSSISTKTSSKNVMEVLPLDRRSTESTESSLADHRLSDATSGKMPKIMEDDETPPDLQNISGSIVGSISTTSGVLSESLSRSTMGSFADDFKNNTSIVSLEGRRMSRYTKESIKSLTSRRESRIPSLGPIKNPLQDMNNRQLVDAVNELQKNTRYLELENRVLLHFLQKNDPSLLEGMNTVLELAQGRLDRASVCSRRLTRQSTHSKRKSSVLWGSEDSSFTSAPIAAEKEGPRINITQKTDLILREMEEIKKSLEASTRRFQILKYKLKAHIEEMCIRESEIQDAWTTFENVFLTGTVEKYTQQKNPADKFMRFMEEWFTNSRLALDKVRLRTSSLIVQYQKVCHQLNQKQLLGENLQIVDFEQLQIENKHLSEKIDHRNLLLLELKKINGQANLLLSQNKKQIFKKSNFLKQIKDDISSKEELTRKFDMECEKISIELEYTKDEHDKIKTRTETYEVPEVLDYVRKKAELSILKKNLKIWERRKQIQDMALLASVREMKHFSGKSIAESWWFNGSRDITHEGRGSGESTFDFKFQRRRESPVIAKPNRRKSNAISNSILINK